MQVSVGEQLRLLAASIAAGVAVGVLYDAGRSVRRTFKSRAAAGLADLLFAAAALAALFFMVMYTGGELRIISLAGAALGAAAYLVSLSRVVLPAFQLLLRAVLKCLTPVGALFKGAKKVSSNVKKDLEYKGKRYKINRSVRTAFRTGETFGRHNGGSWNEKEKTGRSPA